MEFNLLQMKQEVGLQAIEMSKSVVSAAHLYTAVKQEPHVGTYWPDLESFIHLVGEESVFKGNRPEKGVDFAMRVYLFHGLSAQTFAENRRSRGTILLKKNRQQVVL